MTDTQKKRHREMLARPGLKRASSAAMIRRPDIIIRSRPKVGEGLTLISASCSLISLIAPDPELHTGESGCALRTKLVKIKKQLNKFSSHLVLVAATDACGCGCGAITVVSIAFACNVNHSFDFLRIFVPVHHQLVISCNLTDQ